MALLSHIPPVVEVRYVHEIKHKGKIAKLYVPVSQMTYKSKKILFRRLIIRINKVLLVLHNDQRWDSEDRAKEKVLRQLVLIRSKIIKKLKLEKEVLKRHPFGNSNKRKNDGFPAPKSP